MPETLVKILFLGRLVDAAGESERHVDLPPEVSDVEALRGWLGGQVPALLDAKVRVIVNDVLAIRGQRIAPHDEMAFFPPLSGG